jgi:type II secretion system-associated lipoprotein
LRKIIKALPVFLFMIMACDVFVNKADVDLLKEMEKKVYILKKDIDIEGKKLKKGDSVKIVITAGKEWVKVHAYPARANELKADRLLILYLFDDDFQQKHFNMNIFNEQLKAVVGAGDTVPAPEKKVRKK